MLLLDSHALLWTLRGELGTQSARNAIAAAQDANALYVSPITAWELGVADRKRANLPELGMAPNIWFREALRITGAKLAMITLAVAAEAAVVPEIHGRGDPGDCFLIATARVRRLTLVARDRLMLHLAVTRPSYLRALEC